MNDHARRINNAAQIEAENMRMEEMERSVAPLYWSFLIAALIAVAGSLCEDYRTHDAIKREAMLVSTMLARCANGQIVGFDGGIMTCKVKRIIE